MKIGYLTYNLDVKSGWGRFSSDLINGVRKSGHEATVLKRAEDGLGGPTFLRGGVAIVWSVIRAIKFLKKCDLIHALDGYPFGVIAIMAGILLRKKVVITAVGTYAVAPLYRWHSSFLLKWAYLRSERLVAISRFTRDEILKKIKTKKISVINPGIEFEKFYRMRLVGNDDFILSVGEAKKRKGYHISIPAFAQIKEKYPQLNYYIVGSPSPGISRLIKNLDLQKRVIFFRDISDEDLIRIYRLAKLFILLPTNGESHHFEGFGIVFLEAAAAGLPIITTSGNGSEDAVTNGANALVVPQGDVTLTRRALEAILKDRKLSESMSQESYIWAQNHTNEVQVNAYLDLYKELLNE